MASSGSDLWTRMNAGNYKLTCEIAVKRFKERKVDISDAIKTSFPFLETLRDHKFITNKMYKESKASCENPSAVPKVVYAILDNIKETSHLPLLEILFSKLMMKKYPDLDGIREGFRDEIKKKIFHPASVGDEGAENRNTQLSIEQGTGQNPYPFLSWLLPDQSNYTVTSSEDSVEHRNREKPPKASTSALKRKPESMNLTKSSTSGNRPCKRVRSPEASSGFSAEEKCPEARSSAVRSGADQEGFVDPGNKSDLQKPKQNRARQQPDASVNFHAEILPVTCGEMMGLLIKRKLEQVRSPEASSGFSAEEKRPEAGSSAVRSGADQEGFVDPGNKSDLQKPKKKRARQQPDSSVNFRAQILRVTCGEMSGLLIKRKLERGTTRKCIRDEDGNWLTPREFEVRGGYEKASNWKTSLTCGGKTLKQLMELGFIHQIPITRERKKTEENSDKCKICQDGGKLFRCENCESFFHGDCHLPPVDTKRHLRNGWNCTFCTIENSSQSMQLYTESEVLVKKMDPGRKLKCEFLLLTVYHNLESNVFPNIPRGNYVTKASQYLGKLRKLDIIKKKLIKENYFKVKDFMEAMDNFFHDPRRDKLYLNQEEFMKKFKEVFSIRETN